MKFFETCFSERTAGGYHDDHHSAERKASVMEGQFKEMLCVSLGQLSNSKNIIPES